MSPQQLEWISAGRVHQAALRMPTIGETHVLIADPSQARSAASVKVADRLQIFDLLESLDGAPPTLDQAGELAGDAGIRELIYGARAGWLRQERERGTAWLSCPHCAAPLRMSNAELAARLGVARTSLVDDLGRLAPFKLSWAAAAALRGSSRLARAAALAFRLPSRESADAPEWTLAAIDAAAETRAWDTLAPIGVEPPEDRDSWTFESPGFRALLRMHCALRADGQPVSPEVIEAWPLADFCYVDELYALAVLTPAGDDATATCTGCARPFLPVL